MDRIDEKSVSKSQQRLMGQAYAYKKGDLTNKDLNPKYADQIKKMSDSMTLKQLKDFASTKHKGLVNKVKESKILSFKLFLEKLNNNELYDFYYKEYNSKYKGEELESYIYCSIRLDFANEVSEFISSYIYDNNVPKFYSDLCKTNRSPESDYKEVLSGLGDSFKLEDLKKIFNEEIDSICKYTIEDLYLGESWDLIPELSFSNLSLNQDSGLMDTFFYFLLPDLGYPNDKIELGGDSWPGYVYEDEELLVRYKYGYHRTDYGKLAIFQAGMTIEEFKKKGIKHLVEIIDDDFHKILNNAFIEKNKYQRNNLFKNKLSAITNNFYFDRYHVLDGDRLIILTEDITEDINRYIDKLELPKESIILKLENSDINNSFKTELEIYDLDIVDGDVNLVIWDDFEY